MSVPQVKKILSAANHLNEDFMMLACPEAEFLDEIQTKVCRVFLPAIHSHLYSFALRFQTQATSYILQFSYCTL